jgi:hypothetical protein
MRLVTEEFTTGNTSVLLKVPEKGVRSLILGITESPILGYWHIYVNNEASLWSVRGSPNKVEPPVKVKVPGSVRSSSEMTEPHTSE